MELEGARNIGSILTFYKGGTDLKKGHLGLAWWSSGLDSALPMQEAQVQSLVGELRSHMPHSMAKKL